MIILGEEIYNRAMILPRAQRSVHEETGLTYGASFAGYDIRIKQELLLYPGEFVLGSSVEHFTVLRI